MINRKGGSRIIQMGSSNLTLTSTARASRTISESFDARFAASSRSDDARIFRPESCISFFASFIFVPAATTSTTDWRGANKQVACSLSLRWIMAFLDSLSCKLEIRVSGSLSWYDVDCTCRLSLWNTKFLCSKHKTSMFGVQGSLGKVVAKTLDTRIALDTRTERTTSKK